jgi:hypothetical protein
MSNSVLGMRAVRFAGELALTGDPRVLAAEAELPRVSALHTYGILGTEIPTPSQHDGLICRIANDDGTIEVRELNVARQASPLHRKCRKLGRRKFGRRDWKEFSEK